MRLHAAIGDFIHRTGRIGVPLMLFVAWSATFVTPAWGVVTPSVRDGVLTITGDEDHDEIVVHCPDENVFVTAEMPGTGPAPCADLTSIVVTSGGGDDRIDLRPVGLGKFAALASVTIDAGDGNDDVFGSAAPDAIDGGGARDEIFADPALQDVIEGGDGPDLLVTSFDSDVLITEDAFTTPLGTFTFATVEMVEVSGGRSPQVMDGRNFSGRLALLGAGGDDRILGGLGRNFLIGERGEDRIVGGPGDDYLDGGYGRNAVIGKTGDDLLISTLGTNDRLDGGPGGDEFCCVFRSDGALFSGGPGTDAVRAIVDFGTAMVSDSFVKSQGHTARIRSVEEAFVDAPEASSGVVIDASRFSGRTHLEGGRFGGNDVLIGGSGPDELFGLDGDDELDGGGGRDTLDGGPGADICDGGPGRDGITHCE